MKWSLQQLYKYNGKSFSFEDTLNFEEEIKNIDDILGISEIKVSGVVKVIHDSFNFNLKIKGKLVLEDAVTLEASDFPIDLDVVETYSLDDRSTDARSVTTNTIDLREAIWENIILEKPIRFVLNETL